MQKHQELRSSIVEIFSGGPSKTAALTILQHELEHLDVPDGVINEILELCEHPLVNAEGIEPILENLMGKIELFCKSSNAGDLAKEFSKFCSKKVTSHSDRL